MMHHLTRSITSAFHCRSESRRGGEHFSQSRPPATNNSTMTVMRMIMMATNSLIEYPQVNVFSILARVQSFKVFHLSLKVLSIPVLLHCFPVNPSPSASPMIHHRYHYHKHHQHGNLCLASACSIKDRCFALLWFPCI